MLLQLVVGRCGESYHIWREECGDDTHRHHYRIEEIADDAERQSERGNDERELTDLSHGESALHGRLQ